MIEKIKFLKNLAVFNDFDWDSAVIDDSSNVLLLKKTNIIYGRNYSGKTTLSRVIRAMETGSISEKYENPECCISIHDNDDVTQVDFSSHNKVIRVFNDDFIKQNLKFIINPNENVEPFAILGGDNNVIEEEIKVLKEKLGVNEENQETALYKDLKSLQKSYDTAKLVHQTAERTLASQLNEKAIGNPNGIKYNSEKYGDQNYTNAKLRKEILVVKKDEFVPISDEEKTAEEKMLLEQAKDDIPDLKELILSFEIFSTKTKELVEKPIAQSDKIEDLVKDAVLNRWVKEGRDLHKDKLDTCAFCSSEIKETRWDELEKHFDEESDKLEKEITDLVTEIKNESKLLDSIKIIKKDDFYSKYHGEFETAKAAFDNSIINYQRTLGLLISQLEKRKNEIINAQLFEAPDNAKSHVDIAVEKIEELRVKSNEYTEKLSKDQEKAKKKLRLREIYDFIATIKYNEQVANIDLLKTKLEEEKKKRDDKQVEIDDVLSQVSEKQRQLKDESKGADKVNELLNNYFGHNFLSLKAIEFEDEDTGNKHYRFEIHRENKKAFHLSEGENSLIAFCYFMAKLQDIETKGKKPIIWIDDPISSLDSNHIFFIYTLINTQIYGEDDFEQLFISTHNLNFLKYLKRLPNANNDDKKSERKKLYRYLVIERNDKKSSIKIMPNYLRDYVSEFNYLFSQIYKCSTMENVDDSSYTAFYNFGNNARKFLELYLYYKYPDSTSPMDKMKKFFGDENIPAVFTDRLNNEYSHLSGVFERGETVVEVPEMNTAAKLIIERIKEEDFDQYEALLTSIGESQ
ncbi:AAA family ATPase [Flagellimonas zhangzhouensis]|uniref:Wobble nucleotide-excising tRNase n=1 Tax=Flagellimonas zhangzhouensis TaxID=1073328 RepID=A0A1H2WLQ5_9FLAO|nr:AAA family ATPase [Allomuricauda zhangzhouensis]SDQ22542.1 Wobble nucleotide-excising tRNase [Allomuricauda zhangzhouensis]SDW81501.1 Wobble nucleotide-excising tRNase [Allomuricauda zhangzhouensis]